MDRAVYYKRMFFIGAIFNFVAGLGALFGRGHIETLASASPAVGPVGMELLGALVIVFGIGYWIVSQDIARNHGIVTLGIIGKLSVVAIFVQHVIVGDIPMALAAPISGDLIFAALFAEFLLHGRRTISLAP